jgi:hypothetical protein
MRYIKCLILILFSTALNTASSQSVSIAVGNGSPWLTILNIDSSGSIFCVTENLNKSSMCLIRINALNLKIDTLIPDLDKYPYYTFYPTAYPYFINGDQEAKFINQVGERFKTPFKYHIADYALLNDSLALFIADVQYEKGKALAKLTSPLGYYLYNPRTFELINSDTLEIKAKSNHIKGIQFGGNYWSVLINTGLIFNQVLKRHQRLYGFPIDNDTQSINSPSNKHTVLIYNNQGKFIKEQVFEGELISSKQQSDIFLTRNPLSKKFQVWKFDDDQVNYKMEYQFDVEDIVRSNLVKEFIVANLHFETIKS